MATTQFRDFFIEVYHEPTTEELIKVGAIEYAYILHDKDVKDNGVLKKPHYHLYMRLRAKKTINAVGKIFGVNEIQIPYFIQVTNSPVCAVRYLVHLDHAERFQYSISDIKSNMQLDAYFNLEMTDLEFTKKVLEETNNHNITTFKELVEMAIHFNKLDLLMKRSYFFKQLI